MGEILKDAQVIVCEKLKDTASSAQVKELGEAIKGMKEMPPSLKQGTRSVSQTHSSRYSVVCCPSFVTVEDHHQVVAIKEVHTCRLRF